jgi:protein translocase SecG subunit
VKDLIEHLRNYWKVYLLFLLLTALCFLVGWLIGGPSAGLAWALTVDGTLMILIILLQQGRGGGLVGALGGMGGQSAFGARAGDAFTGITVVLTVLWVLLAGFGGITLRADRGNVTFDQPEVRLLDAVTRWEGDDRMSVIVPVYLNGTPTEDVRVEIKANVRAAVQSLHNVELERKLLTFPANKTQLRATVEIEYDGGKTADGDWEFTVQIVNAENAIPKLREESSRVTIMDDDIGLSLPERNTTESSTDTEPVEKKPAEKKPAEKKPAEKKPAEKKPVEKKPVEKKPVEKKPVEKKPVEKKPVEKKPAAKSGE